MGEKVVYDMEIEMKTESDAEAFAKELAEREGIVVGDVSTLRNIVISNQPEGWRGGGAGCDELIRDEIGDLLEKWKDKIVSMQVWAYYVEHAPYDEFSLEDFMEVE